jgi:hypothetical protein
VKRLLFILVGLILTLGIFTGCAAYYYEDEPVVPPSSPTFTNGAIQDMGNHPPDDMNWISPGKVIVTNFYPGARAEYPVTVHNGNDTCCSFAINYRYPDHVGDDYTKPDTNVQDWVLVADTTPLLEPKETRDILITLEMPEDADIFAPQWEFWISVQDTSQGMVKTELCVRWLVTMR